MVKHYSEDYGNTRVYWITINHKVVEFSLEQKNDSIYIDITDEPELETWEVVAFQDELKKCILEYKTHLLKYLWN
jgi:hypothetical protein